MNAPCSLASAQRAGCALLVLVAACGVAAQTTNRSVRAVLQPSAAPVQNLPSPSGLASPMPSPAGLPSQFPAGLPSPLPAPGTAGSAAQALATVPAPRTFASPAAGAADTAPPQTNVLGAAGYAGVAGYGVPAGRAAPGVGSGPYTPLQIAQSFIGADGNRDGELTRAEAQRLSVMPYSFEEMDRDHDGILTRFEYEDAVR